MKKNVYVEPTLRVVEIELHKLMTGSKVSKIGGGIFKEGVQGGNGTGASAARGSEWYGENEGYEEEW